MKFHKVEDINLIMRVDPTRAIQMLIENYRYRRSLTQMTLGNLIRFLETQECDLEVLPKLSNPHSYRGYYHDLAFECLDGGEYSTPEETLEMLNNECLNKTFEGYKGGDYTMDIDTPIWIAMYGETGSRILSISTSKQDNNHDYSVYEFVLGDEDNY